MSTICVIFQLIENEWFCLLWSRSWMHFVFDFDQSFALRTIFISRLLKSHRVWCKNIGVDKNNSRFRWSDGKWKLFIAWARQSREMCTLTLDQTVNKNTRPWVLALILEMVTVRCTNQTHTECSCDTECPKTQRRYLWTQQSTMSTKCDCTVAHLHSIK